jgi:hypothetical protein
MSKKATDATDNNNLDVWNKVEKVPANFLKPILGGRLKGKSDINPMWRLKMLTEIYGEAGKGWTFTIDKTEVHTFGTEAVYVVFGTLRIRLESDKWSEPIQGVGGAMLFVQERNGAFLDDEAAKKAETDAISVACKKLGFGSAVYEGRWDGSKYTDDKPPVTPKVLTSTPDKLPEALKEKSDQIKQHMEVVAKTIKAFEAIGHTVEQLEETISLKREKWDSIAIDRLRTYYATAKKAYDEFHK